MPEHRIPVRRDDRHSLLFTTLAAALLALPAAAEEIFLCRAPEQTVLYSQFPCAGNASGPGAGEAQESVRLEALPTLRVPPLSEAERQRLAALARRAEQQQQRRSARRASHLRDASRERQRRLAERKLKRMKAAVTKHLEESARRRRETLGVPR